MDRAVNVVTAFFLKQGIEDWLLAEVGPLIEASRQLSGCISFDLYQLLDDKHTVMLHETWETEEVHRAYSLSPLRTELTNAFAHCLARPIESWQIREICTDPARHGGQTAVSAEST